MNYISKNAHIFIPPILFIILALFKINNFCITGDEWYSIECAEKLGRSFIAIPYFSLLKVVIITFGINAFALRFVSIIFGLCAVITLYFIGKVLKDARLGFLLSILGAMSGFLISHSQEIRYYSMFAFFSCLSLLSFFCVLQYKTKKVFYVWFIINLIIPFFHPNTTLLFIGEIFYLLFVYKRRYFLYGSIVTAFLILAIALLNLLKVNLLLGVFKFGYTGSIFTTTEAAGMHLFRLAKPLFAIYNFIFGPNVSPYNFSIVIPTIAVLSIIFITGVKYKTSDGKIFLSQLIFLFVAPLFFLYCIAEPLSPKEASSLGPKHAAFAFPVWITLLGALLHSLKKSIYKNTFLSCILLSNLFILNEYFHPAYSSLAGRYTDFKKPALFLEKYDLNRTLFIIDGRSRKSFEFYNHKFLKGKPIVDPWEFENFDSSQLKKYDKVIVVSNDYRAYGDVKKVDKIFTNMLSKINMDYFLEEGFVQYPFFFYIFLNKKDIRAVQRSELPPPAEFFGFEYADLQLPIKIYGQEISGSFLIKKDKELTLQIGQADLEYSSLTLICNLEDSSQAAGDYKIGQISVSYHDGAIEYVDLIKGINIFDASAVYNREPVKNDLIAYSWVKYPMLTHEHYYPGIWSQYTAHLYKFPIALINKRIKEVRINYTDDRGGLRLWADILT